MRHNKVASGILTGLLSMGIFSACTDLDVPPVDSTLTSSEEGVFNAANATERLKTCYNDLGAYTDQANMYSLYAHTSDEMIPPTRGTDWGDNGVWRTLHQHTWDATHAYVVNSWNQLNLRVFRCTEALEAKPTPAEAAEIKFLRAFNMFHVMDLFGVAPFRGVNEGVKVNPKVFTRKEAFDFIVKDLTEALPVLPKGGPKAKNGLATQAAANALLARLFLNKAVYTSDNPAGPYTFAKADMDKVIAYCDAVTADGYALETEYFTNFSTKASKEIIFTSTAGSSENRLRMTLHYDQNPDGWNGFATLADFYDKFEKVDQRFGKPATPDGTPFSGIGRGFLVGEQKTDKGETVINKRTKKPLNFTREVPLSGATTDQGIRVIKYHPADRGDYIFLRYADVVLMKAEATHRGGTASTTALAQVNALRTVRGASQLPALTDAILLDERGRELYWEGIRRTDQIRFGTFDDAWSQKTSTDATRVLFPIPQQALDSNPNLKQNAGY